MERYSETAIEREAARPVMRAATAIRVGLAKAKV